MGKGDIMKIGIATVYLVPEGFHWLFELQLSQIRKNTTNYKIYAADVKLDKYCKKIIKESKDIQLCDLEPVSDFPNKQHGESLAQLLKIAADDGCDWVITLDMDSFPVANNWVEKITDLLSYTDGVVAIQRNENGDTYYPHPCGTCLSKDFIKKHLSFDFYPDEIMKNDHVFKNFIKTTKQKKIDTGVALGFYLWKNNMKWCRLTRSNKKNIHYIMAGIYSNMIFHLGGSSRKLIFRKDLYSDLLFLLFHKFELLPFVHRITNARKNKIAERNSDIQNRIKARLIEDPEKYFQTLLD